MIEVCAALETKQKFTSVRGMGLTSLAEAQVSLCWVFNGSSKFKWKGNILPLTKHAQVELLLFPMVAAEFQLCPLKVPPDIGILEQDKGGNQRQTRNCTSRQERIVNTLPFLKISKICVYHNYSMQQYISFINATFNF